MDIAELKRLVAEAYVTNDSDATLPKFATQFTFTGRELFIRIPIYECQPPPRPLVELICRVINTVLPHVKKNPKSLTEDLQVAEQGKETASAGRELVISNRSFSPRSTSDPGDMIVTEVNIRLRQTQ
ncbi:MAG: hypothetical protein ABSC01_08595 [Verrucomicrobiota bacterium]|jgi:hypothetical protein